MGTSRLTAGAAAALLSKRSETLEKLSACIVPELGAILDKGTSCTIEGVVRTGGTHGRSRSSQARCCEKLLMVLEDIGS
jgi:hypothetical protein